MSRRAKRLLTDDEVDRLRERHARPEKQVKAITAEQMAVKRESARKASKAKSTADLDVKVARYTSWVRQIEKNGASVEWYERKMVEQCGLCAICGQPERAKSNRSDGAIRRLAADHNHRTGQTRGLLCNFCNTQLGALERIEWREKAEAYLASHEAQVVE